MFSDPFEMQPGETQPAEQQRTELYETWDFIAVCLVRAEIY